MTSKIKKKRKAKTSSYYPNKAKSSLQKVESAVEKRALNGQKKLVHITFNWLRRLISFDQHATSNQMQYWWRSFVKYLFIIGNQEHRVAIALRKYFKTLISSLLLLLFFTLIGLNSPASYPPLFTIIHQHKTVSIIIIIMLAFYLVRVLLVGSKFEQEDGKKLSVSKSQISHPLLFLNVISYTSSIFLLSILLLLLIRPSWCPTAICPTPQRIPIFHPQSIHDDNLEMYLIANQSVFYAIPANTAQYTQDNLPMSIPALHADGENSMFLYHLIIGLNSLQQEHFGMIIEEVNLVILKVAPLPHPLDVWNSISNVHYENENQYKVLYLGQQAGAIIPADYLRFQFGFVQLKPGETDQIDVHVISRIEANIWFTVQVVYRIANESQLHPLRLPQQFEIMFANQADWHLYRLQNRPFIANS